MAQKAKKPLNIILMIGDGMGLAQISAASFMNGGLYLDLFSIIGLVNTASGDDYITDSAAGATAYSAGVKTYNSAIGVGLDSDGHKRITTGPNFALVGGTQETHEVMTEKAIKINEKLSAKGKSLEQVSREEFLVSMIAFAAVLLLGAQGGAQALGVGRPLTLSALGQPLKRLDTPAGWVDRKVIRSFDQPVSKVGGLIETVERWWIDGDFTADRAACLAELERLVRAAS